MKSLFLIAASVIGMNGSASANAWITECSIVLEVRQNKEYKKVETASVPASILKDVSAKYSGYVVSGAYASDDSDFMLKLSKEKKALTVYYSASGAFIKEHA